MLSRMFSSVLPILLVRVYRSLAELELDTVGLGLEVGEMCDSLLAGELCLVAERLEGLVDALFDAFPP